jgi:hypothetical protein
LVFGESMEKVVQGSDSTIMVKGLSAETNGTLNCLVGLFREAPPWMHSICNPGKDWRVSKANGTEYNSVLNALIAGREAIDAEEGQVSAGRFDRIDGLYNAADKAARRAGAIKSVRCAQDTIHKKAYWEMNDDAPNKSGAAKRLHTFLLSDGAVRLLKARFSYDAEALAGLIAMEGIGFPGKKEYMEYVIGITEPWLKGFVRGEYSPNGTSVIDIEWSEKERNGWLEKHPGYIGRVDAFFSGLRSSCTDKEESAGSDSILMHSMLRYAHRKESDRIERGSAFRHL